MSVVCPDIILGIAQSGGSCYGSCNILSDLSNVKLCYSSCVTGTLNGFCQPYYPDTVVVFDTLSSCDMQAFYYDFNSTIRDYNMYVFLMTVFVGVLAVKGFIKIIKSAIR